MIDEPWTMEQWGTFCGRFFALSAALGAVINYGRTGDLWWPVLALISAELARSYAPKNEGGLLKGIRKGWHWMVHEDPRWANVPRLRDLRERLVRFRARLTPIGLVALALLVVPSGAAQSTEDLIWQAGEEGSLLQWRVLESNFEDNNAVKSGNFSWLKLHSLDRAINQSILFVSLAVTITTEENANGVWNYSVELKNGGGQIDLPSCYWHHRTINAGVLGGNLITRATYQVDCAAVVDVAEDGIINFWVNRTTLSGTPSIPSQTHLTITAERADFVVYPVNIEITNLWTFFPAIVATAVLIMGEVRRDFVYRGIAGLLFLASMIPLAALFPWYVAGLFGALGFYLLLMYVVSDTDVGSKFRRG